MEKHENNFIAAAALLVGVWVGSLLTNRFQPPKWNAPLHAGALEMPSQMPNYFSVTVQEQLRMPD